MDQECLEPGLPGAAVYDINGHPIALHQRQQPRRCPFRQKIGVGAARRGRDAGEAVAVTERCERAVAKIEYLAVADEADEIPRDVRSPQIFEDGAKIRAKEYLVLQSDGGAN